jgi:FtsP/CotA-like multicopper oxidase with cupredoxin domain
MFEWLRSRKVGALAVALLVVSAAFAAYVVLTLPVPGRAQNVREFFLTAQAAQIEVTPGVMWDAWTYNGTVPGPTLRVRVGDIVKIHLTNQLNVVHSVHVHGLRYTIENDGSQAYPASMPGPGQTYTYTYEATRPGLFYYHCHSSDQFSISYHIEQGLYGAIVVYPADQWPPQTTYEFVEFFAEAPLPAGPAFVINGKQAFEYTLLDLINQQGYAQAVQTLKTAGVPAVPVGTELTFYLVGIGNVYHSWHMHGGSPVFVNGAPVEGDVVPLGPGTAATARVRVTNPGIWLIHCHVVSHADMGMVTLIIAE